MDFFAPPANAEEWLDRSPTELNVGFAGSVVNDAASTIRWTYTVPAGRRAFVGVILAFVSVIAVSVSAQAGRFLVSYQPDGGTARAIAVAEAEGQVLYNNGNISVPGSIYMGSGDMINGVSITIGTTATYSMFSSVAILEFDA